ncbi:hypothetical protein ACFTZB_16020 [Rhodococcus sp. NPDC057014]|uniref:hypothetical protein n=1 Tax=Rhodococcus sp. NPDC057014 TaxID=3346000 RepID=UPI00363CE504
MTEKPDLERTLAPLKQFQRDTVAHVARRLWKDQDTSDRFLVADEVGLGKTLVGRGVIAQAIEHLWDIEERIDIVYICSNAQIARQNLAKLIPGGTHVPHADRLTLLLRNIAEFQRRKLNYISFTPGTSFTVGETGGRADERVLLYHLLRRGWSKEEMTSKAWPKFFRGGTGRESFTAQMKAFNRGSITGEVAEAFVDDLETAPAIDSEYKSLADEIWGVAHEQFAYLRGDPDPDLRRYRDRLIGRMRNLVAHASIRALEPDLIILDEFHRFKVLLDDENPKAELAKALFKQPTAKVLMLSATPFSMYTLPDEPEGADHYQDFFSTVKFLLGGHKKSNDEVEVQLKSLASDLETMRTAAVSTENSIDAGKAARDRVQGLLTRVMSRVERLASTPDRDGMLTEVSVPVNVTSSDLIAYAGTQGIADSLGRERGRRDIFELWRSSPYLFNIMENYQVKQAFKRALESPDPSVRAKVSEAVKQAQGLLNWSDLDGYRPLDAGNAKMRALLEDTVDRGAWKLAWLPPSLPYYSPDGVFADEALQTFTKRLVFSAWTVAPKAIASVLSYEVERRGVAAVAPDRRYPDRATVNPIRQPRNDGSHENLAPEALFQPSAVIAELCDPLSLAQELGDGRHDVSSLIDLAAVRVQSKFDELIDQQNITPSSRARSDPSWYWALPLLLDGLRYPGLPSPVEIPTFFAKPDIPTELDVESLGGFPEDLIRVVTELGIGSPANCVYRALRRATGASHEHGDEALWDAAYDASNAFRTLFNQAEIVTAVRLAHDGEQYWRLVLDYCINGNLQSVLDEFFALGGIERTHNDCDLSPLTEKLATALRVRAGSAQVDVFRTEGEDVILDPSLDPPSLRDANGATGHRD